MSDNQYNNLNNNVLTIRDAQVAVANADHFIDWVDTDGSLFSTYNIATPIHFDAYGNIAQGATMGHNFVSLV